MITLPSFPLLYLESTMKSPWARILTHAQQEKTMLESCPRFYGRQIQNERCGRVADPETQAALRIPKACDPNGSRSYGILNMLTRLTVIAFTVEDDHRHRTFALEMRCDQTESRNIRAIITSEFQHRSSLHIYV